MAAAERPCLCAKTLQGLLDEREAVAGPHDDRDGSGAAFAVRDDRRPDGAAELFEGPGGGLRVLHDAERLDRTRTFQRQPAVRVQTPDRARIVAHGLLADVGAEGLLLAVRDRRDVHECVGKKRMGDLVESDPQEAIPVVVFVGRTRGGDTFIESLGQGPVVGMDLDRRRTEDQIRPEVFDQPGECGAESFRAREFPVGEVTEARGLEPQGFRRQHGLLAPLSPVGGRLLLGCVLPGAVGGDPHADRFRFPGVQSEGASRAEHFVVGVGRQDEKTRPGEIARLVRDQIGLIHRSNRRSA